MSDDHNLTDFNLTDEISKNEKSTNDVVVKKGEKNKPNKKLYDKICAILLGSGSDLCNNKKIQ